ncbi:MAG: Fic family protein [Mycoplasmataceae bacterium]|jgi:hypothetical protein|nr:Fic family protein [Mycoplasmataceae bacterium]
MKFRNEKIEMAHSCMIQSIYEVSKIEGVPFTFPQTEQIVLKEHDAKFERNSIDFDTVIRLKRGYEMCLRLANDEDNFITFNDIASLNQVIGQYAYISYGVLRTTQPAVRYGENVYNPPEESDTKRSEWKKYLTITKTSIDSILEQFFYIIKEQCFNDGNKRTAILVTNVLLLKRNIGFLELDLNKINLFSETIFKYDHNIITIKEAIKVIKDNFIVSNIHDRRTIPHFDEHKEQIHELEESLRTNNITKNQLAKMVGYDPSNLNKILSFKIQPSVRIAKLIGDILKIDWKIFFD